MNYRINIYTHTGHAKRVKREREMANVLGPCHVKEVLVYNTTLDVSYNI